MQMSLYNRSESFYLKITLKFTNCVFALCLIPLNHQEHYTETYGIHTAKGACLIRKKLLEQKLELRI